MRPKEFRVSLYHFYRDRAEGELHWLAVAAVVAAAGDGGDGSIGRHHAPATRRGLERRGLPRSLTFLQPPAKIC